MRSYIQHKCPTPEPVMEAPANVRKTITRWRCPECRMRWEITVEHHCTREAALRQAGSTVIASAATRPVLGSRSSRRWQREQRRAVT